MLHRGRRRVVTQVVFEADGAAFAFGETSFQRSLAEEGASPRDPLPERFEPSATPSGILEALAIETLAPKRGGLRFTPGAALRNPNGSIQGTAVALFAEACALSASESALGPRVGIALELRYLAAGRRGPIVGEALPIHSVEADLWRVLLRDDGDGGRVTASAVVGCAPPPDAPGGV